MGIDPLKGTEVVVEDADNLGEWVVSVGGLVNCCGGFINFPDHFGETLAHLFELVINLFSELITSVELARSYYIRITLGKHTPWPSPDPPVASRPSDPQTPP